MKVFFLIFLISSAYADIPVISFDGNDEKIIGSISSEDYKKTFESLKRGIESQLIHDLRSEKGDGWRLSQIWIGLGTSGEIGLGPWKFGTTLKQRFIYVRQP